MPGGLGHVVGELAEYPVGVVLDEGVQEPPAAMVRHGRQRHHTAYQMSTTLCICGRGASGGGGAPADVEEEGEDGGAEVVEEVDAEALRGAGVARPAPQPSPRAAAGSEAAGWAAPRKISPSV